MEVSRGGIPRPWPAPTSYQEVRPASHRAVYVHLPDGLVTGELLRWLFSEKHGWYGYVSWERKRMLHTEPIPADRIEPYPHRSR